MTAPDETKSKKVTFSHGLPRGTCATFTHEGQRWIAYPQSKVTAIAVALDNTLGTLEAVGRDLVRWINDQPQDAARIVEILARVNRRKALAGEKVRAWTMQQKAGSDEDSSQTPRQEGQDAQASDSP